MEFRLCTRRTPWPRSSEVRRFRESLHFSRPYPPHSRGGTVERLAGQPQTPRDRQWRNRLSFSSWFFSDQLSDLFFVNRLRHQTDVPGGNAARPVDQKRFRDGFHASITLS